MKDYTSARFKNVQNLHRSGMMVGMDRPVTRATWCKQGIRQLKSAKNGMGTVRYLDKNPTQYEFTGMTEVDISRSIGQDAATCTITMWNTHGSTSKPEGIDTEGRKGYLSPGRGDPIPNLTSVYTGTNTDLGMGPDDTHLTLPMTWNYPQNMYRDVFVPNTVIRTFQGYGSDNFDTLGNEIYMHDPTSDGYVPPEADAKLYQSGTWLIDQVTIDASAQTITLECRDLGKLLIEQYIYPPLLPIERFPLIYCPAHKDMGHKEVIGKNVATHHSASTDRRYGTNGQVLGHRARDAFDGKGHTFWLSGANTVGSNLEWLQAKVHGEVNEIVLHTFQGNYLVYICVHAGGKWQGSKTVHGNSENLSYAESPGDGGQGFIYVIATGDTLWDLAGTYYGDHFKWPIIARANSNIIKDPHWIYPGQRIKIPYVKGTNLPPPSGAPTHTGGTQVDIPYVMTATVPSNGIVTISLPKTYSANYVRVVFTNLNPSLGAGSPYRAGVREMTVRNHIPNTFLASTEGKGGSINDWTEPIKEMCAWAGLTWENAGTADPVIGSTSPNNLIKSYQSQITALRVDLKKTYLNASQRATVNAKIASLTASIATLQGESAQKLAVWGDFEILGAGPIVCTPGDYFMSKSFMDGIGLIRDFIGAIFFIDETGGAQFRLPNIWSAGNFVDDPSATTALSARVAGHPIEFHEDVNLLSYSMVISDADVRSEVLVVGGYPKSTSAPAPVAGGYVLGYNSDTGRTSAIDFSDVLAGQYRIMIVPGETTNLFYTETECQRMAELTALFILFTYRTATAKIVAHPGLQLDDQVRIFERTTYETNIHYISGINSTHNLESGEWTMDVTCHWLGGDPNTEWFVNKQTLTPAVTNLPAILKRVGKQAAGGTFEQPVYGV